MVEILILIAVSILIVIFLSPMSEPHGRGGFLVYRDNSGEFRWKLQGRNYRTIADSGEGYSTKSECKRAIRRVRREILFNFFIKDRTR